MLGIIRLEHLLASVFWFVENKPSYGFFKQKLTFQYFLQKSDLLRAHVTFWGFYICFDMSYDIKILFGTKKSVFLIKYEWSLHLFSQEISHLCSGFLLLLLHNFVHDISAVFLGLYSNVL